MRILIVDGCTSLSKMITSHLAMLTSCPFPSAVAVDLLMCRGLEVLEVPEPDSRLPQNSFLDLPIEVPRLFPP